MRNTTIRTSLSLAASLATVAALAPAAAHADLAGAPTLRVVDADRVGLKIAVDEKLARKDGAVAARVTVAGRKVRRLETSAATAGTSSTPGASRARA
jgi:hypothetical protein